MFHARGPNQLGVSGAAAHIHTRITQPPLLPLPRIGREQEGLGVAVQRIRYIHTSSVELPGQSRFIWRGHPVGSWDDPSTNLGDFRLHLIQQSERLLR